VSTNYALNDVSREEVHHGRHHLGQHVDVQANPMIMVRIISMILLYLGNLLTTVMK